MQPLQDGESSCRSIQRRRVDLGYGMDGRSLHGKPRVGRLNITEGGECGSSFRSFRLGCRVRIRNKLFSRPKTRSLTAFPDSICVRSESVPGTDGQVESVKVRHVIHWKKEGTGETCRIIFPEVDCSLVADPSIPSSVGNRYNRT